MNVNEPYLPVITLQDILAFCPDNEQTYTSSRLVNAVANILFKTNSRETKDFAAYLQLDKRRLSVALEMETGMTLKELIIQYRLTKIKEFIAENPKMTVTEVASHFEFSSLHALWRFFQTYTGETPEGLKSEAPRVDNYHKMVQEIRSRYR